jgi:excisionase family DNA binding protein
MEKTGLMTKEEVQEYLRISHQTLQRYMKEYCLPYIKLGRRVLFDPVALRAWLKTKTIVSGITAKASRRRTNR